MRIGVGVPACLVAMMLSAYAVAALAAGDSVRSYVWPKEAGFSDKYRVLMRQGDGPERELQVLMSKARAFDYRKEQLEGRTFSFVNVSFSTGAAPLRFRIVKLFGDAAKSVSTHPKSYGYPARLSKDGQQAEFTVDDPERYLSVNFVSEDNRVNDSSVREYDWIRHMLCVFVDPTEEDVPVPGAKGVVTYSTELESDVLANAETVIFPAGYHNLRDYRKGGIIDDDGKLTLMTGKSLYLEGGSFVEGIIQAEPRDARVKVYGRGLLTGRQYMWPELKDFKGVSYRHILGIGQESRVEGITVMESPLHGIVGMGDNIIKNVKFIGWHCNNDGVRVKEGSEISHSFFRSVDDHFYNFAIHAHDLVIWAGHNGAILTYGWSGGPIRPKWGRTYKAGASLLENIDIIHPEWTGLGNNNGLVAAQTALDYKPYGFGGETTTILRNIRIEGAVPGLLNLKPRTGKGKVIIASKVDAAKVGYLGDLVLENVSVEAMKGKSLIKGASSASTDGDVPYLIKNVTFRNVRVGGELLTKDNADRFFNIDADTTKDISFE